MKKLYTTLLIGLLSITFTPINTFSQSIDANRMNRDINIMENILSELFKTTINSSGSEGIINSDVINNGVAVVGNSSTRGTYLPGFGIIFMVSNPKSIVSYYNVARGGTSNYSFYYNTDKSKEREAEEVDQQAVTTRINEFLRDYGSTIGQLKNDEKVMIIYGATSSSRSDFPGLVINRGQNEPKKEALPVISVSAKAGDLKDYRSGKLNQKNFDNRLKTATSEDKEYLDLKVMGTILETALKGQEEESFKLIGSIDYMLLDNFGALYSLDVRYNKFSYATAIIWDTEYRRENRDELTVVNGERNKNEESKEDQDIKVKSAYTKLITNIKEYVVDYGRTLSSLSSDQFMLLTVDVNGRYENIPNRLDIQIKKSDLEQLDKGSISREQAIERVIVTEY